VSLGLEVGLLDRLAAQARPGRPLDLARRQRLDQGGDRDVGGDVGLYVHPPHLDGAEARVRPHVPPEVGVVGDAGGGDQLVGDFEELVVAAEGARDFEARVAAQRSGAGAGEAGVEAFAKGRVGGDRLQQRQAQAHRVGDPDRRFRVRHADVDVEAGRGRVEDPGEVGLDGVVARFGDELDGAFVIRVQAGAEQFRARRPHTPPQAPQLRQRLIGVGADPRLQLDLGGEDLGADTLGEDRVQARDHLLGDRHQAPALVDQE
jgi:hypothetical protein